MGGRPPGLATPKEDRYGRVDAGSKWPGIVVEVARTDRSVCHWYHEAVQAGQFRIGMQSTSKPRMVIAWQHPGCFAEGMDFVTTSPQPHKPMYGEHRNQSCRHTGKAFSVNEPRLACTGETCVHYFKLSLLRPLIAAALDNVPHWRVEDVPGFSALSQPSAHFSKLLH